MAFIIKHKPLKSLKYIALAFIFTFIIILLMNTEILRVLWLDEDLGDTYIDEKFSLEILREDVTDCLADAKRKDTTAVFTNDYDIKSKRFESFSDEHSFVSLLTSFNDILSFLHIKAVIIEPSILYCMLLPKYKGLLAKRHFNISDFLGSTHIVTYGIMEEDVTILQEERNIYKFSMKGFNVHFNQVLMPGWMLKQSSGSKFNSFTSHMFYRHKLCIIHIVVFYKRNNYFWHAALDVSNLEEILPKGKLLLTDHNSAYEKFSFISLENNMLPIGDFYIPSNAHYFLLEIMSSRFIECSFHNVAAEISDHPKSHPYMSIKNTRTALRTVKKTFHPLLMHLWIKSETLLGWYRQCDIIPRTTDINFGSWVPDVEDLDLITKILQNNKHAILRKPIGLIQESLEMQLFSDGLQANIFFMYWIQNGSWNSRYHPKRGYYFRYFYPPFMLCSSELLGEKVQVPCEAENVISAEYG